MYRSRWVRGVALRDLCKNSQTHRLADDQAGEPPGALGEFMA
jgi:hypothetical protein